MKPNESQRKTKGKPKIIKGNQRPIQSPTSLNDVLFVATLPFVRKFFAASFFAAMHWEVFLSRHMEEVGKGQRGGPYYMGKGNEKGKEEEVGKGSQRGGPYYRGKGNERGKEEEVGRMEKGTGKEEEVDEGKSSGKEKGKGKEEEVGKDSQRGGPYRGKGKEKGKDIYRQFAHLARVGDCPFNKNLKQSLRRQLQGQQQQQMQQWWQQQQTDQPQQRLQQQQQQQTDQPSSSSSSPDDEYEPNQFLWLLRQ